MSAFNAQAGGASGGEGLAELLRQLLVEQQRTNTLLEEQKTRDEQLLVELPRAIAEQIRAAATG